jgi:hypothetical protein
MDTNAARPVRRPQPLLAGPQPTIVRVRQDSNLFRGWGVTL